MHKGSVDSRLVLSSELIWATPHLVQSVRREGLRWDEFLRVLVNDLAFGMTQEKWIDQLLREGNVGLAQELVKELNLQPSVASVFETEEREWLEMVEIAKKEASEYIETHIDDVTKGDQEEYEELLNLADKLSQEGAYGDAVSTLEQGLRALESVIERRQIATAQAFSNAESIVSEARVTFAATKPTRFSGGSTEYMRTRTLLLKADERLYSKDYTLAIEIARWVKAMCTGSNYPSSIVDELLLESPLGIEPQIKNEEILLKNEPFQVEQRNIPAFEQDWTREDDEYLIDNYDVLSNDQLMLRFHASESEIQQRILYLGLMHDREIGKQIRWRNPYVAGKPLRGKQVFVGREDVFTFIEDSLGPHKENEDRNLVVLLGHRRTGKTSILLQLRKNRREILEPRIPIFIDMEKLLPFPGGLPNFFWKLACSIQEELEDLEGIILPQPRGNEFTDPSWDFRQFLRRAEQAVGERGLVLMLDEFQAIEPRMALLDVDVYKMLRSIIQHDTRVDFILSGTMEMERLMHDYQAAMFGSAISKKIDFLDEEDARKLIIKPVQTYVTYSKNAVDLIVEAAAAHPYFVQLICWTLMRYLIDRGKSKVSASDVERILPRALEQGVHFNEIWATETTELERYVMAVVGELSPSRGSWCTVTKIEQRLRSEDQMPKNADEFDEALFNLTNRRILRHSDNGSAVRFQVDVFGHWVSANKPFEIVRRDIRAEEAAQRRRIGRQPKTR